MNPCRKLRSRLLAVAAMLTLGAVMQAAAPVRPAAEPAGVPLEPRTVYLTFDDGPSRNTEAILSVLREEEVPATFFVTLAEREDDSDAYAALCENGSRVALHCSVHDYDRLYESARSYREDLRELEAGLRELGIPYETLVRLPGGSLNAQADPRVLREILTGLSRDGYTVFDWTVTSGDDGGEGQPVPLPPEEIARNALERGEGQSSPVILLHDSYPFTTTPEAARQIIRAYKARGYRFGVLTADTRPLVFSDWWDVLSGD